MYPPKHSTCMFLTTLHLNMGAWHLPSCDAISSLFLGGNYINYSAAPFPRLYFLTLALAGTR